jgi:hypothetical protein
LECGGLPPLCSPLRGFAKIKNDGKGKMPGCSPACLAAGGRYKGVVLTDSWS